MVSQLARQVEGLAQRLLHREPLRVLLHCRLHRGPHLRRGPEEAVCRDEAFDALMRPAEVVPVDEEAQPPDAVVEVGEHRPREEFVPQRLPEALHLAQRLRVVRPRLDVADAVALQLSLEDGLPSPRRVLPAVVRQHLDRRAERREAPVKRLEHQLRFLLVRDRVPDDEAAEVVHEDGDVEPLMPAQQEGEDVRLPQLIRLRPLEAPRQRLRLLDLRRPRLQQPFFMQNPPHRRLRDAKAFEPFQHIRDSTGAKVWVLLLRLHHARAPRILDARRARLRSPLRRHQRRLTSALQRLAPLRDR